MMNDLADRIYDYVKERIQDNYSPTVREICADLGIKSTSTVHKYLNVLIENGLLEKDDGLNRALRLPNGGHAAQVPVLGLSLIHISRSVDVGQFLFRACKGEATC